MNGNIAPCTSNNGTHQFGPLPDALNSYTTIHCQHCGGTLQIQPGQAPTFTPNTGTGN
ncbi:MAG TPA: hypothetical protein VGF18_04465 [Candidatus Tumulicola sp.]|jgi:hypothetical protein